MSDRESVGLVSLLDNGWWVLLQTNIVNIKEGIIWNGNQGEKILLAEFHLVFISPNWTTCCFHIMHNEKWGPSNSSSDVLSSMKLAQSKKSWRLLPLLGFLYTP